MTLKRVPSNIRVIFFYIQSKNSRDKLLNTLLKLLYNNTTTIPRGAKYNDNPEALKRRKIKKKTFKQKPEITIKKDTDNKNSKRKRCCKEKVLIGCVVCSRVWKELNLPVSLMNCNVSSRIFLLTSLGRFSSPYNKSCVRSSFERLAYPNGRNSGRISARRFFR